MKINKISSTDSEFPVRLHHIASPPKELFVVGADIAELLRRPAVAIIGSRKVSTYGKAVTERLASELARAGVCIISGLAIGVDGIAHQAAVEAGGACIAVLPGGLTNIYPTSHRRLADAIVAQGGALVSEYNTNKIFHKGQFIERNRLVSGLCDALLITEAAEKSGTLHTANFALDQGREVLAVPGNITSPTSAGTNRLIKTGATLVTETADVLRVLGIEPDAKRARAPQSSNPTEQTLLDLLHSGVSDGGELLTTSQLEIRLFNQALTMLEIRGLIRPLGNNQWTIN